ncbi:DUF1272 domain-containing protein [Flagellimonas sp. 2504JD1-5]
MLTLRPNCEHCGKSLPSTSEEAMICSFECTYCDKCAMEVFENVCPSCGGNFEKRPIRPTAMLRKYPASTEEILAPKEEGLIDKMKLKYKHLKPSQR